MSFFNTSCCNRPGTQRLDAAADALLNQHTVNVNKERGIISSEIPAGGILIVTDPENDEADGTCLESKAALSFKLHWESFRQSAQNSKRV